MVPGGLLTLNIARDYFNYEDNATRDIPQDLKIIADYSDPVGRRPVSGVSWYLLNYRRYFVIVNIYVFVDEQWKV